MKSTLFLAAMTLIKFGMIEITTKNETNSLNHTKYEPAKRLKVVVKQEEYDQEWLNRAKIVERVENRYNSHSLHYALEKALDCKFTEEINEPGRLFSIFIEDYFEQTDTPQANDLAIYTYDEEDTTITHVAVLIDRIKVESQWGYEIRQHILFHIPTAHPGYAGWFYTLKKEYKGPNGKKKAAAAIEECIKLQKKIFADSQQ